MAGDASFDVVSDFDEQELRNALDQVRREVGTRFDFKGVTVELEQSKTELTLLTDDEHRAAAIKDLIESKAHYGLHLQVIATQVGERMGVDLRHLGLQGKQKCIAHDNQDMPWFLAVFSTSAGLGDHFLQEFREERRSDLLARQGMRIDLVRLGCLQRGDYFVPVNLGTDLAHSECLLPEEVDRTEANASGVEDEAGRGKDLHPASV